MAPIPSHRPKAQNEYPLYSNRYLRDNDEWIELFLWGGRNKDEIRKHP